jgi:hypothetical protein
MRAITASSFFAFFLLACSSTSTGSGGGGAHGSPLDVGTACNKFVNECKQPITQAQCEATFGVLLVSADCANKVNTATCQEITQSGSSFDETCFPNCTSPDTQTCNGDGTITICSKDSRTLVADCAATCEKAVSPPAKWTGTCGKQFGTQPPSDKDKCWCQ